MPQHMIFILFLATCCFAPYQFLQLAQAASPVHHIYWHLKTQSYQVMYAKLQSTLKITSKAPPYEPQDVRGKYVLGQQRRRFREDEPPAWIHIHVTWEEPRDKVTLAIAADDLCLLGFRNATSRWHKFQGGFPGFPIGTVELPISENYGKMIRGGHKNLWKVPLGNQSAIQATKQLARYDSLPQSELQLKDGLVRFVVMMSEAMRFKVIRDTFWGNNWNKQTSITETQAKYVVDWGSLSRLLIWWARTKQWGFKSGKYKSLADKVKDNSGVKDMADTWNIVGFLLRPQGAINY